MRRSSAAVARDNDRHSEGPTGEHGPWHHRRVHTGSRLIAVTVALLASACTSSGPSSSSGTTAPVATSAEVNADGGSTTVPVSFTEAPLCLPECQPPSPVRAFEVRGTSDSAEIYGLMRVDEEIKVVWRMTGSGELSITATGPTGESVPLTSALSDTADRPTIVQVMNGEAATGSTSPVAGISIWSELTPVVTCGSKWSNEATHSAPSGSALTGGLAHPVRPVSGGAWMIGADVVVGLVVIGWRRR